MDSNSIQPYQGQATYGTKTIPITVDKSHLIVIGERLYAQSLELIRELISNAYDADATHIWIEVTPYTLSIKDDGSGMDEAGLRQYFNIGSQEKHFNKKSAVYSRMRIGEFGIGKFAALSACDVFTIHTQKGHFAAKLTFDKNLWNSIEGWEVPVQILEPKPFQGNGTTITLENLKKELTLPDIERFIKERIPLKVPNFQVFLNEKQMSASVVSGKKFPVRKLTSYGMVSGEITVPNFTFANKDAAKGIDCFVKDVFIRKETFGFEYSHSYGSSQMIGQIYADFLPITSDRSRFITDSPAYKEFYRIMRLTINDILKQLKIQISLKEDRKADTIVKDALSHIRKALKKNPEFAPQTQVPVASKEKPESLFEAENFDVQQDHESAKLQDHLATDATESEMTRNATDKITQGNADYITDEEAEKKKRPEKSSKKIRVRTLTGKQLVARKIQIGNFGVVCKAEPMGESGPPVTWESGIIFINRDHPLYKRFSKHSDTLTLYVTELIAQEIAGLRANFSKDAFSLKNQILTDAWT